MPSSPASRRPHGRRRQATRGTWAVRVAAIGAVAASVVLVAVSFIPYDRLQAYLDPLSVDRDADVTRTEFDAVILRLRLLVVGFAALALALLVLGHRLGAVVDEVGRSWWTSARTAPRGLRAWVAREPWGHVAAFALILATGVMLRLAYLDVPLRYDEATTYGNFVSRPVHVALANYATPNNHLFHTLLAKSSVMVFGSDPWAIRLPALIAGIALIPAAFALARVLFGRTAALLAAAFVAVSSTLVEYSTNARGYTIVALVTFVAFLAASRALERDSTGAWALVAVACALGVYAVPVMIYAAGGVFVWILASGVIARLPRRMLLLRVAATGVATGVLVLVLYSPVLAASGIGSVTSNEFVESQPWSAFASALPEHVETTLRIWGRDVPSPIAVLVGVGIVAGIALTPRISRFRVPPLAVILVWSALVLVVQRVVPFPRVWLAVLPVALVTSAGFYGWLAECWSATRRGVPLIAASAAIAGALAVYSTESVRESRETGALLDAPAIASFLADRVRPGDRILATGSDVILEYYLEREGIDAGPLLYTDAPRARTFVVVNVLGGQTIDDLVAEIAPVPPEAPRLLTTYPSGRVYLVARPA